MKLVCDLILTNIDTGKITRIPILESLHYDEERKDIVVHSYGQTWFIKNIESFKFEFRYRMIPDEENDEPIKINNSDD